MKNGRRAARSAYASDTTMPEIERVYRAWLIGLTVVVPAMVALLWMPIVLRQQRIINRIDEISNTLGERTSRFERLEKSEQEQRAILEELRQTKGGKRK